MSQITFFFPTNSLFLLLALQVNHIFRFQSTNEVKFLCFHFS